VCIRASIADLLHAIRVGGIASEAGELVLTNWERMEVQAGVREAVTMRDGKSKTRQ